LLSNTDKKKAICDENNLVITSVYLELHYNDHTVENTVWSLSDEDREIVKTIKALKMICKKEMSSIALLMLLSFPLL